MMQLTVAQALKSFAAGPRPLKELGKMALMDYHKEHIERKEQFDFLREVLYRRHIFEKHAQDIHKLQADLKIFSLQASTTTDALTREYSIKRIEALNVHLARAQKALGNLGTNQNALSHAEVMKSYRDIHLPIHDENMTKHRDGKLFICHDWGFMDFLTADGADIEADQETFKTAMTHAQLAGSDEEPEFWDIREFARIRIAPSRVFRKKFLDVTGQMKPLTEMTKDGQKAYWDSWRRYNQTTFERKWKDRTEMAYDARSIDNYKRAIESEE